MIVSDSRSIKSLYSVMSADSSTWLQQSLLAGPNVCDSHIHIQLNEERRQ